MILIFFLNIMMPSLPNVCDFVREKMFRVVSGLPGAFHSICCLGVSTILESEKIVKMI